MAHIDELIAIWSMRPAPVSPEGKAWEQGCRQGYAWGVSDDWTSVKSQLPTNNSNSDELPIVWARYRMSFGETQWKTGLCRYSKTLGWQPLGATGWDWIVSHFMFLPGAETATDE